MVLEIFFGESTFEDELLLESWGNNLDSLVGREGHAWCWLVEGYKRKLGSL